MTDHSNVTLAVENITPMLAEQYLAANTGNRNCSKKCVSKYARAIRRGEWRVNGEAIKFSESGQLLDGQHRLRAVMLAETAADFCVIRGLDIQAFKTLDIGKGRNGGDCLYILNYKHPNALAAAGRMLFAYEREWGGVARSFRAVSNDELLDTIKRHPGLVTAGHQFMRVPYFTKLVPNSSGMFCNYLMSQVNARDAAKFFSELSGSKPFSSSAKDYPVRVLQETLYSRSLEVIRPTTNTKLAWVVHAWNCLQSGQKVDRFPRIVDNLPRLRPDPVTKVKS